MNLTTTIFMSISVLSYSIICCCPTIHENIHVFVARMLGDKGAHIIDGNKACTSLTDKKSALSRFHPT
jgi:hypothetical protein